MNILLLQFLFLILILLSIKSNITEKFIDQKSELKSKSVDRVKDIKFRNIKINEIFNDKITSELNDISQEMNTRDLSIEKHRRISKLAEENKKMNENMRELAESKHLLNLNTNKLFTLEQKFHTMKSTLESNNELLKDIRRKLLINPIDNVISEENPNTISEENSNTIVSKENTETSKKLSFHSELAGKDLKINQIPHIVKPEMIPSTATVTPDSNVKYAKSVLRTVKSIDRAVNCPPCPSFENTKFVDSGEVSAQTLGTIIK